MLNLLATVSDYDLNLIGPLLCEHYQKALNREVGETRRSAKIFILYLSGIYSITQKAGRRWEMASKFVKRVIEGIC